MHAPTLNPMNSIGPREHYQTVGCRISDRANRRRMIWAGVVGGRREPGGADGGVDERRSGYERRARAGCSFRAKSNRAARAAPNHSVHNSHRVSMIIFTFSSSLSRPRAAAPDLLSARTYRQPVRVSALHTHDLCRLPLVRVASPL
jgi:hypothetical protein